MSKSCSIHGWYSDEYFACPKCVTNVAIPNQQSQIFPPQPPVQHKEIEGVKNISRDDNTLYTYYQVELENINEEWDTSVCESLEEVYGLLQYLDIHLDDDTETTNGEKRKVIITGIPLTPIAYKEILIEMGKSKQQ